MKRIEEPMFLNLICFCFLVFWFWSLYEFCFFCFDPSQCTRGEQRSVSVGFRPKPSMRWIPEELNSGTISVTGWSVCRFPQTGWYGLLQTLCSNVLSYMFWCCFSLLDFVFLALKFHSRGKNGKKIKFLVLFYFFF
jgi:hypothetical protein